MSDTRKTEAENLFENTDINRDMAVLPYKDSYLITMRITPNNASKLGFVFRGDSGRGFEFRLDFEKKAHPDRRGSHLGVFTGNSRHA